MEKTVTQRPHDPGVEFFNQGFDLGYDLAVQHPELSQDEVRDLEFRHWSQTVPPALERHRLYAEPGMGDAYNLMNQGVITGIAFARQPHSY